METELNNKKPAESENGIQIQDLIYIGLAKWRWFAISLFITISTATIYILRTPPVYTRTSSILIKEDSKGKSMGSDVESFADFGLFQANTNVNNELIALQSPAMMQEVVKRLHLEVNYSTDGRFHKEVLYGTSLPITITMSEIAEDESASLNLQIKPDGKILLSNFVRNGEPISADGKITGKMHDTIVSPIGKIIVTPTANFTTDSSSPVIHISQSNAYSAVTAYSANLSVTRNNEKASVISLSIKDVSTQRAEEILSTMIAVYNENWVKDKNQIAVSTSRFINERLGMIERELGNVDSNISSYKSEHLLPNVETASNMYMTQSNQANTELMALNNQLYMTRYIREYLSSSNNKDQLLPANSGIENSNIESQIAEYNTKQLQRNSLVANSSTQNPLVVDLDHALSAMRKAIITTIDNQMLTLKTQIDNLQKSERQTTARIAASPTQAKYLLSVERQQKVKEALYLYLLQKREENELSQAFTAYNTRIIMQPSGKNTPTSPVKRNIYLIAFVLGLLAPAGIIYLRVSADTTVRGRKDLEEMTIPFIGEIPLLLSKRKRRFWRKATDEVRSVVVKEGSRNMINEAFRVLRTNLEFMTEKDHKSNVIMLTSMNPGSGKTFLTMNIAMSLAIKGKKVLVIDGDLRRGSSSSYINSPKPGLSDYLGKRIENYAEAIVIGMLHKNMDILPIGTIPPNPAELLEEERFASMIDQLREKYDYIFIDCPPFEIVADAQIIEKAADRTILVVRAGLFERSMLPELETIYNEKKFKNISMVLNASTGSNGQYGGYHHRYGYHYGYKYGYHYGHYYNDGEKE